MILRSVAINCAAVLVISNTARLHAQSTSVDERPLRVHAELAFPDLKWPDWVTGASEGITGEVRPLIVTGAGDGTNRIFLARQPGTVHVFPNDRTVKSMKTFLDIRERLHFNPRENEEGFLGLAFHPKFKDNGQFFVYYTAEYEKEAERRSIISRFRLSKDDPDRADPDSEEILLEIPQPFWNHNGGTIIFGPDGMLYVGLGDGGSARDPFNNGQKMDTLLGKILRIDVDNKDPGLQYAIPKDNPFVDEKNARGEIWALGIRNVWRIAFDRETGLLWAGDVGQDVWEEIDIITRGGNYGWRHREGKHPHGPDGTPPRPEFIEPIWEYHHDVGKSITGGNVYRGKGVPELEGAYLYADWVTGQVWALWYDADAQRVIANRSIVPNGAPVMTFGEDDEGETYYATQPGEIYRFRSPKSN